MRSQKRESWLLPDVSPDSESQVFLVCVHNVSPDQPYVILQAPVNSTAQDIVAQVRFGHSIAENLCWHVTTLWVRCPLWVNQPRQLSLPSLRDRRMSSVPCNYMDYEGGDH